MSENPDANVCFITAIFGGYEASCKRFAKQTIPTDFICFTDRSDITSNGWIIDTTPYHITNPSPLDNGSYRNSLSNNKHTFNIAKYYKQAFSNIPRLARYEAIIWIDGTIEVINPKAAEITYKKLIEHKCVGWSSEYRKGSLESETTASSNDNRYTTTKWGNQEQPIQPVLKQLRHYISNGFNDNFFLLYRNENNNVGVWVTCYIGFLQHDIAIIDFLNQWYNEVLSQTTQDQISFPYIVWKTNVIPYTFPDSEIQGDEPHCKTSLYIKHSHGR